MLPADFYQTPKPSFPRPVPIPDAEPDEPPLMTVCFNRKWAAVLLGAATQLTQLATWDTDDPDAALLAQEQANQLVSMLAGDTASVPGGGLDFGGCMPEMRLTGDCGLEVNCGTPDEPNWQPVFTTDHPEGSAAKPYPPDTVEYIDDTARCICAANIAAQLKYGTETLANDAAIVGGIAVAIIDLIGAFLFFVPGGVLVDIAIAIINLAVGHVASDFSGDLPAIDWESARDGIACLIERDGSVTESDREAVLAWMATQYVGNLAWALSTIIVQNVSADGLTVDARMPQNDIAIDGCAPCPYCHSFNFRTGMHGWEAVVESLGHGSLPSAIYVAGVGWKPNPDNVPDRIRIKIPIDPLVLTGFTGELSTAMTGDARWSQLLDGGSLIAQIVPENTTESVFSVSHTFSVLNWILDNDSGDAPFNFAVTDIELCGTGAEPIWE